MWPGVFSQPTIFLAEHSILFIQRNVELVESQVLLDLMEILVTVLSLPIISKNVLIMIFELAVNDGLTPTSSNAFTNINNNTE